MIFLYTYYCHIHTYVCIIICSLLACAYRLLIQKYYYSPFVGGQLLPIVQVAPAVYLAMEHLNNGDGSVIPEVEGLNERCPIRFTTEMIDSNRSPAVAVDKAIEIISRENQTTCALAGAGRSPVTIPLAIISGIRDIPQISPLSTSEEREYIYLCINVNLYNCAYDFKLKHIYLASLHYIYNI